MILFFVVRFGAVSAKKFHARMKLNEPARQTKIWRTLVCVYIHLFGVHIPASFYRILHYPAVKLSKGKSIFLGEFSCVCVCKQVERMSRETQIRHKEQSFTAPIPTR